MIPSRRQVLAYLGSWILRPAPRPAFRQQTALVFFRCVDGRGRRRSSSPSARARRTRVDSPQGATSSTSWRVGRSARLDGSLRRWAVRVQQRLPRLLPDQRTHRRGAAATKGFWWVNHEYPNGLFVGGHRGPGKEVGRVRACRKLSVGGSVIHIHRKKGVEAEGGVEVCPASDRALPEDRGRRPRQ